MLRGSNSYERVGDTWICHNQLLGNILVLCGRVHSGETSTDVGALHSQRPSIRYWGCWPLLVVKVLAPHPLASRAPSLSFTRPPSTSLVLTCMAHLPQCTMEQCHGLMHASVFKLALDAIQHHELGLIDKLVVEPVQETGKCENMLYFIKGAWHPVPNNGR